MAGGRAERGLWMAKHFSAYKEKVRKSELRAAEMEKHG